MLPFCMQFSLKLIGDVCPSYVEYKLCTVKCTICFKKTSKLILALILLGNHTGQWWLDAGPLYSENSSSCRWLMFPEKPPGVNYKFKKWKGGETFDVWPSFPHIFLSHPRTPNPPILASKHRKCWILKDIFTQVRKIWKWQAMWSVKCGVLPLLLAQLC